MRTRAPATGCALVESTTRPETLAVPCADATGGEVTVRPKSRRVQRCNDLMGEPPSRGDIGFPMLLRETTSGKGLLGQGYGSSRRLKFRAGGEQRELAIDGAQGRTVGPAP